MAIYTVHSILRKTSFTVALAAAALSYPIANANTPSSKGYTFIPTEKENVVILKKDPHFPLDVIGMPLNAQDSMAKSRELGAVAQYIVNADEVDSNGLDKKALIQEMNDSIMIAAQYFKNKPEYKGTLVLLMTYYPGYKKPYQVSLPKQKPQAQAYVKGLNEQLKNHSKCNNAGFCSMLGTEYAEFFNPNDSTQKLDKQEYSDFSGTHTTTQNIHVYHTNPKAKPMGMFLYMGINGHLTTPEFVKAHIKEVVGRQVE